MANTSVKQTETTIYVECPYNGEWSEWAIKNGGSYMSLTIRWRFDKKRLNIWAVIKQLSIVFGYDGISLDGEKLMKGKMPKVLYTQRSSELYLQIYQLQKEKDELDAKYIADNRKYERGDKVSIVWMDKEDKTPQSAFIWDAIINGNNDIIYTLTKCNDDGTNSGFQLTNPYFSIVGE